MFSRGGAGDTKLQLRIVRGYDTNKAKQKTFPNLSAFFLMASIQQSICVLSLPRGYNICKESILLMKHGSNRWERDSTDEKMLHLLACHFFMNHF